MITAETLTTEVNAEVLGEFKFPDSSVNFLIDELYGEELTDRADDALAIAGIYEDAFLQSIVLHTLETVRGAERRGLLDELTIGELMKIIYTDVGIFF
jgi:hypothetical protein